MDLFRQPAPKTQKLQPEILKIPRGGLAQRQGKAAVIGSGDDSPEPEKGVRMAAIKERIFDSSDKKECIKRKAKEHEYEDRTRYRKAPHGFSVPGTQPIRQGRNQQHNRLMIACS